MKIRKKITVDKFNFLNEKLKNLGIKLNNYIQTTRNQLKEKNN